MKDKEKYLEKGGSWGFFGEGSDGVRVIEERDFFVSLSYYRLEKGV